MKFSAMLWFIGLWAIFVYSPIAHWVWGPDGFLAAGNSDAWIKVLDFAGGTVVHINSGVAGLMACLVLGKRKDTGPGHNMVLTFIGASLLWVGWFGFNAGSAVTAGMQAGMAMLVTQMRDRGGGLHLDDRRVDDARQADGARHLLRRGRRPRRHHAGVGLRRPDRLARASASPPASSATGAAPASSTCSAMTTRSTPSACTRVGGIVGALLTGVFAVEQYGGTAGLIDGNPAQFLNQVYGVVIVFVYDAIVSLIILKIVDIVHRPARQRRGGARGSRSRAARRDRALTKYG